MKTVEIKIFKLNELSEETQSKVIEHWRENDYYFFGDENEKVLNTFESLFPVIIKDWQYDAFSHSFINFTTDYEDSFKSETVEALETMTGIRLATFIWNNFSGKIYEGKYYSSRMIPLEPPVNGSYYKYKKIYSRCTLEEKTLTGYCLGHDILKPLFDFMNKPTNNETLESLLNKCLNAWLNSCIKDVEYWYSEESIREDIEANDYDFTVNGKLY